ncbi:AAA ATPase central domain protein [Segniliparus rotundus DSM 44985]|uniref:AAA ATPase central domain protein n=1 Tax=Segniliparus rotundus (strain ATCC BAA-972 / CDC 1076 / CIP 108378 / DSM 44985 / JCM 13578) TaxID=640132 RepID=D6ZB35_SEGRD|nr:type VII secretion AAA-ATPase EccA [Segniliparus rotundus]ADG96794.1 AAA ATPase central domain protein [Segniliparus rotundus DSM 44985]
MYDTRAARRSFDIGILSLGIPIDGQEAPKDLAHARKAFDLASRQDPTMSDAWLGLATTLAQAQEELPGEIVLRLYENGERNLFAEHRRLGLPPRTLGGRFSTGLYIDYPLTDWNEIQVAKASLLIRERSHDEAEQLLKDLRERTGGKLAIVDYVTGFLYYGAQLWPDVLVALRESDGWSDRYLASGADLMVGSSCAQLGLFSQAVQRLERAESGVIPAAQIAAKYSRGLVLREQGEAEKARAIFEEIYAREPGFEANKRAMQEPTFRIVTTTPERIALRANRWDPSSAPSEDEIKKKEAAAAEEKRSAENEILLAEAQQELDLQIGMSGVKQQVARLQATVQMARLRAEKGLGGGQAKSQHLAFTGPPGTGKTTIARVVAKIYCGLGLLKTANVLETSRKDFVGEHLGSTAIKTTALIDRAMDGVLFIDEAYTLLQSGLSGGDAFGKEAIDTLLARMENDRDRLVVIIAGYDNEIDRFLAGNEGLASRFAKRIRFDSYTPDELGRIAEFQAKRRDAVITPDAMREFITQTQRLYDQTKISSSGQEMRLVDLAGNGRFVRNVIEAAEEEREFRLTQSGVDPADLTEEDLMSITAEDLRTAMSSVIAANRL